MTRRRTTLRTRLLAGLLLGVTVVVVAFDVVTVTLLRTSLTRRVDGALQQIIRTHQSRAAALVDRTSAGRRPTGDDLLPTDYYVAVLTADRGLVALAPRWDVPPSLPADLADLARSGAARTFSGGTGSFRMRAAPTDVGTLVVAGDLGPVADAVDHLRAILAAGTAVALVVLAAGGTVLVRRSLRPLESMAEQADRISPDDLAYRVVPRTPDTEVGRLGLALNRMLARIEASVRDREAEQARIRRFFADASHELRTPLTSLRANAELYEQGALTTSPQVDEAMRRIRISAQRMGGLVDDMLRLARMDQHPTPRRDVVDVSALVTDCVRDVRAADGDRVWTTRVRPGLVVRGDADLLRRAVDNLLGNVATHTPPGTTAEVRARLDGEDVVIEVGDDGPGVPEHAYPLLFDRFYRVDGQPPATGSGLGLAIVAEVAALHGGRATATANIPHGLRVRLTVPVWPQIEPP